VTTLPTDLAGRIVLVTGGGGGLGGGCARALAARGATVVIADRDEAAAARQAEQLRADGAESWSVGADVADPASADAMVEAVVERFGKLDAAVNNAGISGLVAPLHEYSPAAWREVMAVNLDGMFYCTLAEVRVMRQAGAGSIVNISSILGMAGTTGSVAYSAAKHGVVGLTRCTAIECAADGIRANAVGPGRILTPMLEQNLDQDGLAARAALAPMNRLGRPAEVGEAVAWLCSDGASFITGAYLPVDGGFLAG
jgi:NAD(P)-dependent dehydrogenase (short-subunit alcohol dehydrogenase family)